MRYKGVYPSIDLVCHDHQGHLEYDFIIALGTDPKVIRMIFKGADKITVNKQGNLVITTSAGEILMHRPNAYQEADGISKQIHASYVLNGKQQVALQPYRSTAGPEVAKSEWPGSIATNQV